jgi:hypothetical protein
VQIVTKHFENAKSKLKVYGNPFEVSAFEKGLR